jgi:hypothetical protein
MTLSSRRVATDFWGCDELLAIPNGMFAMEKRLAYIMYCTQEKVYRLTKMKLGSTLHFVLQPQGLYLDPRYDTGPAILQGQLKIPT